MNDVMLLANHKTSLRTMVPLGQYFKEHSGLNPVLLLLQSDRMLDVDIRTIGFDWDTTADINESSANSKKKYIRIILQTYKDFYLPVWFFNNWIFMAFSEVSVYSTVEKGF